MRIGDGFVFDGQAVLKLPTGQYQFKMERGPEYRVLTGNFQIDLGAADNKTIEMVRFANMAKEGWYSGDLSITRLPKDMPRLLLAEDLMIGVVTNDVSLPRPQSMNSKPVQMVGQNRFFTTGYHFEDHDLGAVSFANATVQPISVLENSYPWSFLTGTSDQERISRNVNLVQPYHWDLPVWLASNQIDSVAVLHHDSTSSPRTKTKTRPSNNRTNSKISKTLPGRQPDRVVNRSAAGLGRWSMDVYFRMLEAGFRMPPTAISRSGVSAMPVGSNRVYVFCGEEYSYQNWWTNLQQGKCVITNGPLIRPFVEGHAPGHVFRGYMGKELELEIELKLSTRVKISYLEIIKNGQSFHEVRLAEFKQKQGQLPKLKFTDSGWFLVRAIGDDASTYKYACSAPFYVEFDGKQRITKKATQYFVDWSQQRLGQVQNSKVGDPTSRRELLRFHKGAVKFWKARHLKAL